MVLAVVAVAVDTAAVVAAAVAVMVAAVAATVVVVVETAAEDVRTAITNRRPIIGFGQAKNGKSGGTDLRSFLLRSLANFVGRESGFLVLLLVLEAPKSQRFFSSTITFH